MNKSEIVFKGKICSIDFDCCAKALDMEIFYHIINVENRYFFAEEISTGCIFPTYSYDGVGNKKSCMAFQSLSYLRYGKYFLFASITGKKDKIEKSYLDIEDQKRTMGCPSEEEVRKYLMNRRKDQDFIGLIREYEKENKFFCDIDIIKQKIAVMKEKKEMDLSSIQDLGYDLVLENDLCNVYGREEEVKEIIKNIVIKNKSVLLVGPSGVGKTSLVEYLAKLTTDSTNMWLKDKMIFCVNTSSLVHSIKNGEFEEKMNRLISFCSRYRGKMILFIDNIDALFELGYRDDSAMDVLNILITSLRNGDIVMIGATTKSGYDEYICRNMAICRRFEKIELALPDKRQSIQILMNYIEELEHTYQVYFDFSSVDVQMILNSILEITDLKHYSAKDGVKVTNLKFAKSLLEEAILEVKYNGGSCVRVEDICLSVAKCDRLAVGVRKKWADELKEKLLLSGRGDGVNNVLDFSKKKVLS